jgi:hypothetical protein
MQQDDKHAEECDEQGGGQGVGGGWETLSRVILKDI